MNDTVIDMLARQPFFRAMAPAQIQTLAGCAREVDFEKGESVLRQGDYAHRVYIILEGKVAIQIHGPQQAGLLVQTVHDNEMLGWSWLIPPYKWHFDAVAMEPTRAIAIDAACLRGKMETDPGLGYELLKRVVDVMAQRLHATRFQLLDVYGKRS